MLDVAKLISFVSSPLGRDWERSQLLPHRWRAKHFDLTNYALHVCRSGNFCRGSCLFLQQSYDTMAKALQNWKSTRKGHTEVFLATTKMLSTLKRLAVTKECLAYVARVSVEFGRGERPRNGIFGIFPPPSLLFYSLARFFRHFTFPVILCSRTAQKRLPHRLRQVAELLPLTGGKVWWRSHEVAVGKKVNFIGNRPFPNYL